MLFLDQVRHAKYAWRYGAGIKANIRAMIGRLCWQSDDGTVVLLLLVGASGKTKPGRRRAALIRTAKAPSRSDVDDRHQGCLAMDNGKHR